MNDEVLLKLIQFRQELHRFPEVSEEEKETSQRILGWLRQCEPNEMLTGLGGYGVAAVFEGKSSGQTIVFRAELDALPLKEINSVEYRSARPDAAHLCGHDGHMAIMAGLAVHLHQNPLEKGKVVLLFQPAEETGTGAEKIINDPAFTSLNPDYIFAIHNLPGFPRHQIILSDGHFAAASTGMIIRLKGRASHAAEPEKGRSPAKAVAHIIQELEELPGTLSHLQFALLTIVHVKIGEIAFGTTPGEAVVMATLRAFNNNDLKELSQQAEEIARSIADAEKLGIDISYTESFPATINDPEATNIVRNAAKELNLSLYMIHEPFKWTEDFGHFSVRYKSALIGLGSGEKHPALHSPDYDFPDELITTGVKLLAKIAAMPGDSGSA